MDCILEIINWKVRHWSHGVVVVVNNNVVGRVVGIAVQIFDFAIVVVAVFLLSPSMIFTTTNPDVIFSL